MSFAGITTGAIALFLLGLVGIADQFAADYAGTVSHMFDLRVFLTDRSTPAEITQTVAAIRRFDGVSQVTLIPKESAWEKMKKEQPDLTRNLENPLPDQLKVVVTDLHLQDRVVQKIQSLPTVSQQDGVHYLRAEQRIAIAALNGFKVLGPALFILLACATTILLYNTIRLTVISRRLEIRIMQLVGAPQAAIRIPFLIEGTVQGVLAGVLAASLLWAALRILSDQMNINAVPIGLPVGSAAFLMILLGGGYGFFCSALAVRVPLEYR